MTGVDRVLALVWKELLALLRDPRSRVVVIAPPILQTLVFGYAATFDLNDLPYAVYDQDRTAASRALLADFRGSPHFHEVAMLDRDDAIAALVDARRAVLVVSLERGFAADLAAGRAAPIQLLVDGRNSNTAMIALGYANRVATDFVERWQVDHGGAAAAPRLVRRAWFNPNLESRWFVVPGLIGLLTLLVTMVVTSLSVAREREQGTFDQLLVTPLRPAEILLGKALPGILVGLAEATVMLGIVTLWFEVPLRGSLITLYAGIAVFLLSAVGVGLMISSLATTLQQGLLGAFLFMVPAILLSGFATPVANMPPWLQTVTLLNPLRYFLRVLRGSFLEGAPFALLWQQFWPMALIGGSTLAVAGWLFRRRLD